MPTRTWSMPFGGTDASDTFETGTRAAAFGGTTTIVDFAVQDPGRKRRTGARAWHQKAGGQSAIDYGFHQIIGDVDDESISGDGRIDRRGRHQLQTVHGLSRCLTTPTTVRSCARCNGGRHGALIMMHAENGIAIDDLVAAGLAR